MIRETAATVQPLLGSPARGYSDLLAIGFGTTVAMWAVGYVGHMPLTDVPPAIFVSLMLLCVFAGGWIVGRRTPRSVRGGAGVGLIVGLLNLLILGSVKDLLKVHATEQIVPQAALWVSGYFVLCISLATFGTLLGTTFRARNRDTTDWPVGFVWIACIATLLLISVGGLVTGFRAGMAVPDWPSTYGSNMFLFPLAKMTGGVFYEHAHRLLGFFVGVTVLTLAILITVLRPSAGAIIAVWIVGLFVIAQAIFGALRVTENDPDLAVLHGFVAHLILAGLVAVAVLLTRRRQLTIDEPAPDNTDRLLSTALVLGIMLQTLLGTLVRQKGIEVVLLEHISLAMFVVVLSVGVGVRLWGLYPHVRVLARGGVAIMAVVVVQLILGGISLAVRTPPAVDSPSAAALQAQDLLQPAAHALITTLHQTTAAVLLGLATFLAVWCWRLRVNSAANEEEIVVETEVVSVQS